MARRTNANEQEKKFSGFGLCEMAQVDPDRNRRRYYCILLQPGLFEISLQRQWGRIGSKRLRVRDESFSSLDMATQRANRLYRERLKRGYLEF